MSRRLGSARMCEAPYQHDFQDVIISIGTSAMLEDDPMLAGRIVQMVNGAYGYRRISDYEVRNRMAAGDSLRLNRVLHLAWRDNALVGCCSSTIQPPFTCCGVGHWGFLSVEPSAQGTGVATALISAAEQRLAQHGCIAIQIEYQFVVGDELSERLRLWYEGRLGFRCLSGGPGATPGEREFRICHKWLRPTGCSCCHLCVIL
eukprot:gnl/MRDRNA2_/MRDRNA2_83774_c1_seq2.p1 gnl/MRDRNA2_/MRDRNA2_83774_c1~~gnl/MRDRNA2_/MRDRNA2_83774_c1_seq2.p1  ORF type:complete len:203 (+),score=9.26 gnl/MRDRNA2_/MRDRNA2_83774_c1_seq2:16-624(+)